MMQTASQPPAPVFVVGLLFWWHRIEKALAVTAFSLIAVLIFGDVAARELLGPLGQALGLDIGTSGIYGAQKKALYLLVIGAFLGIGVSVATAGQIVPTLAFGWLPARWSPLVDRLSYLTSALILAAVVWYGVQFVAVSREIGTLVAGLHWPAWQIQAVIPAGFASAALRYLIFAIWPAAAPGRPEFQE